jgi:hypothetical protein
LIAVGVLLIAGLWTPIAGASLETGREPSRAMPHCCPVKRKLSHRFRVWVLKKSNSVPNGRNFRDRKCLEN